MPQPKGGKGRWYQGSLNVAGYFQDCKDNEYVLFNRDPNGEFGMELSFLKLEQDSTINVKSTYVESE